ncbi:uncharacterized protein F5Z01DRAFT_638891 [Emericellopsis atlantica]|uniref:Uncharacterized protein n=1 Tax=Emericellopsis atlantica TaxID=2614577 RepID=A0A9P8CLY7_9HYPO|nr:uncharacterized protein F5Z01DRAFT_638891 [Emericellopsis atlantica]KAG9251908.1 hypothetical protein F5Z01DRAFT_638891 [Emericellopsis atlantica]
MALTRDQIFSIIGLVGSIITVLGLVKWLWKKLFAGPPQPPQEGMGRQVLRLAAIAVKGGIKAVRDARRNETPAEPEHVDVEAVGEVASQSQDPRPGSGEV